MTGDASKGAEAGAEALERAEAFFRLPPKNLSAEEFWRVYYSGSLTFLSRDLGLNYDGEYDHYTSGQMLPRQQPFEVSTAEVGRWDFFSDVRFSLGPQVSTGAALAAVIGAAKSTRNRSQSERAFGVARILLGEHGGIGPDVNVERERVTALLAESAVEIDARSLVEAVAGGTTSELSKSLLGYRDVLLKVLALSPPSASLLVALIDVVERSDERSDIKSFAIWAIGRNGAPGSAPVLIRWLGEPALDHLVTEIQRALQFLGSGRNLLPIEYSHEAQSHWVRLRDSHFDDPEVVAKNAAESVLWERRLGAALWGPAKYLPHLLLDEVIGVRDAAKRRSAAGEGK